MRVTPVGAVLALAILTLAPSECSGVSDGPSPGASASPTAKPPSEINRISTSATCPVQMGQLEGRFTTSSEMDEYLACIVPQVEKWVDAVAPGTAHPQAYFFIPRDVTGAHNRCEYDDTTLFYCPSTQSIYFGEQSTWRLYTQHGDAAAAMIMAHEATHHLQNLADLPPATIPNEQIRYENQADCGGGAFMRYALSQNWVTSLTDDLIDVLGALAVAGSSPGPDQDHGSSTQRLGAFGRGAASSDPIALASCNRYVPEQALVK